MFRYRVQYADYESDIQNNDLLYKIDPKCQTNFDFGENVRNTRANQKLKNSFCNIHKLHNSYFVVFVIFGFLDLLFILNEI